MRSNVGGVRTFSADRVFSAAFSGDAEEIKFKQHRSAWPVTENGGNNLTRGYTSRNRYSSRPTRDSYLAENPSAIRPPLKCNSRFRAIVLGSLLLDPNRRQDEFLKDYDVMRKSRTTRRQSSSDRRGVNHCSSGDSKPNVMFSPLTSDSSSTGCDLNHPSALHVE